MRAARLTLVLAIFAVAGCNISTDPGPAGPDGATHHMDASPSTDAPVAIPDGAAATDAEPAADAGSQGDGGSGDGGVHDGGTVLDGGLPPHDGPTLSDI